MGTRSRVMQDLLTIERELAKIGNGLLEADEGLTRQDLKKQVLDLIIEHLPNQFIEKNKREISDKEFYTDNELYYKCISTTCNNLQVNA